MKKTNKKLNIRGLQYNIHEWGDSSNPTLFLLHGWMDCGASFKFIAPYLIDRFHIVAPDLRGFGDTGHAPGGYWFPDYFADLDALLAHYSPDQPVNLVGHSMGSTVVMTYAGIQTDRVEKVMSLDGFGAPATKSEDAVMRYREWMSQVASNEPTKVYPDKATLRESIKKGNPTFTDELIDEMAKLWAKPVGGNGEMMLKHDHRHRYTNPVRYNHEDTMKIWEGITAKTALVMASDSINHRFFDFDKRLALAKEVLRTADEDCVVIENSYHMLHIEKPELTAQYINRFFID